MRTALLVTLLGLGAHAQQPTSIQLNNGLAFDSASFGLQVYSDAAATSYTLMAIDAGFRNFFASVLAGNQKGFGDAVKQSNVPREALFICGSVNSASMCSGIDNCDDVTTKGWQQNLADLDLDYVDMIMLDYPGHDCDSITGQWRSFEAMLAQNLTRSIAVSNFSPAQLDCVIGISTTGPPQANQMHYSVGMYSSSVLSDNTERTIVLQSYSPLDGGQLVYDPDFIAIGLAHNKSSAQVRQPTS